MPPLQGERYDHIALPCQGERMPLLVSSKASDTLVESAKVNVRAHREAARIYALLTEIEQKFDASPDLWQVGYVTSGLIENGAQLKNGCPLLRLCPGNIHCIALLTQVNDTLTVLAVCRKSALADVESHLINRS